MNRRDILRLGTIPAIMTLSGCTEYVHRMRGVDTPADLSFGNATDESHSIELAIERDGEHIFEGIVEIDGNGNAESVEGDDYSNAEFSEAGSYTMLGEVNDEDIESSTDLSWRELTDCNTNNFKLSYTKIVLAPSYSGQMKNVVL